MRTTGDRHQHGRDIEVSLAAHNDDIAVRARGDPGDDVPTEVARSIRTGTFEDDGIDLVRVDHTLDDADGTPTDSNGSTNKDVRRWVGLHPEDVLCHLAVDTRPVDVFVRSSSRCGHRITDQKLGPAVSGDGSCEFNRPIDGCFVEDRNENPATGRRQSGCVLGRYAG
ncbi:hypothetical protein BRC68_07585 [Halobacteriales archaeon QH_6_64_20]|nr:MAG: hypothetical protein BRC68_07585 [Halobacteriales archaeon QH_6_64_20]